MAADPTSAPLLLTVRQAAQALAVSERTLWALTQRGELPSLKLGRLIRYSPAALETWIAERQRVAVNGKG